MKKILGPVLGAALVVASAATAATQPAASVSTAEAAKLAEAHGIINIMFPPATREQMMDKMMTDLMAPVRQNLPMEGITDPGLKALFKEYMDNVFAAQRPLINRH